MSPLPPDWESWRRLIDLDAYEELFRARAAEGNDPHGEADLISSYAPRSVLDAGCGTGRLGIELARRGVDVLGVDSDPDMIAVARAKAPEIEWVVLDVADLDRPERFDVVTLAGNVVPYVRPERRAAVVRACARHLGPGGRLVAGFQTQAGWPTFDEYDRWCTDAGLTADERFATWEREPFAGGEYAVLVHRQPGH